MRKTYTSRIENKKIYAVYYPQKKALYYSRNYVEVKGEAKIIVIK